jgi:hypothetical protein
VNVTASMRMRCDPYVSFANSSLVSTLVRPWGQICYPAPLKSALCFCRHQAITFYNRRTDPCPWGASCCYACMVVVTVQHLGAMPGCVSAGIAACLPVPGTTGVPRSPHLDRCDQLLSHLDPIRITIPAHWHQTACGVDPTLLTGAKSQQIRASLVFSRGPLR